MPRSEQDRLLEEYLRQKEATSETKKQFPNLAKLFGENVFRQPLETSYNALKTKAARNAPDIRFLGSNLKEMPLEVKEYRGIIPQSPEDQLFGLQRYLEGKVSEASTEDIYNAKSLRDLEEKAMKEIPKWHTEYRNFPSGLSGYTYPNNKAIELDPEQGNTSNTLLHELGHARTLEQGLPNIRAETPISPALLPFMTNKPEKYRRLFNERNPDITKSVLTEALRQGKLKDITEASSKGHIPGYNSYSIERPIEIIKSKLKEQGFEEQEPEQNPKF